MVYNGLHVFFFFFLGGGRWGFEDIEVIHMAGQLDVVMLKR